MAPKKQAKFAPATAVSSEFFSESTSLDASQSQDRQAADLQEAGKKNRLKACQHSDFSVFQHPQQSFTNLFRRVKTQQRREQQKKEVLANHEARQTKLKCEIEECLKKHDHEVREIRRRKIERLLELAQQKRLLEEKIEKCQSELDQVFLTTANQLQIVLDGRIESLSQ